MSEFGEQLRRLLAERGVSQGEAARRVPCDSGYVSKLASGGKRPSPEMAARLDQILEADGALAALAPSVPPAAGQDGRERLAWARQHPRRIDHATVGSLASVLAAQRRAEDTLGSAAMIKPVAAQLAVVGDLVTEARGPVRPALVDVAGQWAQFAGWLHASARLDTRAARLYDRALQWAVEAGDVNLISEVVSMKGHLEWMAGHPGPVIGLSQAAQRDPAAFPGQHAISAAQEARGHAMAGAAAAAERKLGEALAKADAAAQRQDEAPPWLYYHSPAFFDLQRGLVYRFLAADPRYRERAIEALQAGYAGLPDSEKPSDWGAVFLCHLAAAHELGGDVHQAAAVAVTAARIARQTGSARLREMLLPVHARLAARRPDDPDVAELAEALR
jgi:transcriptional regulator with XRE-family HTH domain